MSLNPTARKLANGNIELSWTPDPSCFGYRFYRDNVAVAKSTRPTQYLTTFAAETDGKSHSYGIAKAVETVTEFVVFPPIDPGPPPSGVVRDCFPGEWPTVYAAVKAGETILMRGGLHNKIKLDRSFPATNRVTVKCETGSLAKGTDVVGGAGGNLFDTFFTRILAADTPNKNDQSVRAFNINGPVHDVDVVRSRIEGGFVGFSPYCGETDGGGFCTGIKLKDSEVLGSWGDLIHPNGCKGLEIDHNFIHDPQHLTAEHHDGFQPERCEDYVVTRNTYSWLLSPGHWTGPITDAGLGQAMMLSGDGSGRNKNGVIGNNLAHHWNGRGLNVKESDATKIYSNTILFCGDEIAITFGVGCSGTEAWNNIGESFYSQGPPLAYFDYNWATKSGTNIAQPHGYSGDPKLGPDFKPLPGSPVRGKGIVRLGLPVVDLDGIIRPAVPGVGAFV